MVPTSILAHVVEVGRATLDDLDPLDVPGTLRKVAQQTGKRLAPPMARRLLEEIDVNEWLRLKVADRFGPLSDSEDPTREAAALFLHRPEGWEGALELLEAEEATKAELGEIDALAGRVKALEQELDSARGRAKRAQRELEMAEAEAEKRVTAARVSSRAGRDSDKEALAKAHRDNAALSQRLSELAQDHEQLIERHRRVRGELLRERRVERPVDLPPPASVWADLDAVGAARLLDEVAASLAPAPEFVEPQLALTVDSVLQLPAGVAPDGREAVEWLIERSEPYVLVVDGYNVTYLLHETDFTSAQRRDHLNRELARFKSSAASGPRVIVVYDSDQPEGITTEKGPGGVEIRYTAAGHTADDEVLVLATELGGQAAVVSTDRHVRESSEAVGALGLWSQALVAWIKSA